MPTTDIKKKNKKMERPTEISGYLTATMVSPLTRATMTTAMQNPRMHKDTRTRAQKNTNVKPVLGSSLEMIGLPDTADMRFWMRYALCMMPVNSTHMAVYRVNRAK